MLTPPCLPATGGPLRPPTSSPSHRAFPHPTRTPVHQDPLPFTYTDLLTQRYPPFRYAIHARRGIAPTSSHVLSSTLCTSRPHTLHTIPLTPKPVPVHDTHTQTHTTTQHKPSSHAPTHSKSYPSIPRSQSAFNPPAHPSPQLLHSPFHRKNTACNCTHNHTPRPSMTTILERNGYYAFMHPSP